MDGPDVFRCFWYELQWEWHFGMNKRTYFPFGNLEGTVMVWGGFVIKGTLSIIITNYEFYVDMLAYNLLPKETLIKSGKKYFYQISALINVSKPATSWFETNSKYLTEQIRVNISTSRKICTGTFLSQKYTRNSTQFQRK